jgi:hypothetical protein
MSLNPIGLIILAIAAFVAALVLAYNKSETFRKIVDVMFEALKKVGNFIKNFIVGYFTTLFNIVTKVKDVIVELVDRIKNSPLGTFIGGIVDSVTQGRAVGGSVSAGQAVRVGELGSEVFIPSTAGRILPHNQSGGGGNTFIFNGVIDGESARRSIERVLQNSAKRTAPINLVGSTL